MYFNVPASVTAEIVDSKLRLPNLAITDEGRDRLHKNGSVSSPSDDCEPVWPSGMVLGWKADVVGSIPRSCSPLSSKDVVYEHRLVTVPLRINET